MNTPITFITGNAGKAEQLSKYLGITVDHHKVDLTEIQSLNVSEIVSHKAKQAYLQIKGPVIVDDVSLIIHAMGKLPGPFVKYFISELSNEGICKSVSHYEEKSATAEVCIGYYDGEHLEVFSGVIEGTISQEPLGNGGFGWDAIFIPEGYTQTRSEMSEADYDDTSPRKFALDKLREYLSKER